MQKNSGFTMIELMIALVIFSLVATFAYTSYRNHIIETNRTEARSALQTAAATLEKCKSLFGVYNHGNCNYSDFATESNVYNITVARNATAFTLTARPVAGSIQAEDADCTALTLTNIGIRQAAGGAAENCW